MMDALLPVVAGCSHRTGTVQTYSSNARKYIRFCGWLNSDPFAPATERVLSMCAILYCLECSANGLASWVSAVAAFHTSLGHGELPRHTLFHAVKAGLHNVYAQVDLRAPATALDMSDLDKLRKSMDFSRLVDVRFWCATILGFQGLFRASEILRVRWEDIAIGTSVFCVTIAFSKQDAHPVPVTMIATGDDFCPVRMFSLLRRLVAAAGGGNPFTATYASFLGSIKLRCVLAGVTKKGIKTHSLRRGGTTALALAGVTEAMIQAHGRWSSLEYRKYICYLDSALQRRPTAMLWAARRKDGLV